MVFGSSDTCPGFLLERSFGEERKRPRVCSSPGSGFRVFFSSGTGSGFCYFFSSGIYGFGFLKICTGLGTGSVFF